MVFIISLKFRNEIATQSSIMSFPFRLHSKRPILTERHLEFYPAECLSMCLCACCAGPTLFSSGNVVCVQEGVEDGCSAVIVSGHFSSYCCMCRKESSDSPPLQSLSIGTGCACSLAWSMGLGELLALEAPACWSSCLGDCPAGEAATWCSLYRINLMVVRPSALRMSLQGKRVISFMILNCDDCNPLTDNSPRCW